MNKCKLLLVSSPLCLQNESQLGLSPNNYREYVGHIDADYLAESNEL